MALLDTAGKQPVEGESQKLSQNSELKQWLIANKLTEENKCDVEQQLIDYGLTLDELSQYSKEDMTELTNNMLRLNVIERNRFVKGIENYKLQLNKQSTTNINTPVISNNAPDPIENNTIKELNCCAKVVTLGATSVGKSSIMIRFVKGEFNEYQESTIGASFLSNTVTIKHKNKNISNYKINVKIEIWDTAGQEKYHSLAPMYYRGCKAALIIYDITSYDSFQHSKKWIKELESNGMNGNNTVIILVGNKIDLNVSRKVSIQEAQTYAKENNILFFETSAKTNENIKQVFIATAKGIVSKVDDIEQFCKPVNYMIEESQKPRNDKACCLYN